MSSSASSAVFLRATSPHPQQPAFTLNPFPLPFLSPSFLLQQQAKQRLGGWTLIIITLVVLELAAYTYKQHLVSLREPNSMPLWWR